jgi:hypothetical protein
MSLDRQMDTLTALYAEKSDGELLDLAGKREGLTEKAQQALDDVMRERGLAGRGAAVAMSAGGEEAVDGDVDEVHEGEVLAYLFHDAFEAREAIRCMTEAGIEHRMLDWHVVEPEMTVSQTGLDLGLVVQGADGKRTMAVLKEKLGLFPSAEGGDSGGAGGEGLTVLSMFERGGGVGCLGGGGGGGGALAGGVGGVTYLWRDGRDAGAHLPDEETVAIEVRPEDVGRATTVVEDALAETPE